MNPQPPPVDPIDPLSRLATLSRDENFEVRLAAAREFAGSEDLRAVPFLIQLLADQRREVREAAAIAIQPIYHHFHNRAKKEVVNVLGKFHFSEALPLVLAVLLDPRDVVAATAAESFLSLADPRTVASLFEALVKKANYGRARAVAEFLLKFADASWIPKICRTFECESGAAKELALLAMRIVKDEHFIEPLADCLQQLEHSQQIKNNPLVWEILETYQKCANDATIPRLTELFIRIPSIRDELSLELSRLDAKDAARIVLLHLSDHRHLGEFKNPQFWALDWAISICSKRNEDEALIQALCALNGDRVFCDLKQLDKNDEQFGAAVIGLLMREPPACVSRACILLRSNRLLRRGYPPDLIQVLLKIIQHSPCEDAIAAALLLSDQGINYSTEIIQCCKRFVSFPESLPKVLPVLGKVKSAEAVRVFVSMVSHSGDFGYCGESMRRGWEDLMDKAFSGHGDDSVGAFLEVLGNNRQDDRIRRAATLALSGIPHRDAITSLIAVCRQNKREWERYSIGIAAATALMETMAKHSQRFETDDLLEITKLQDLDCYYPSDEQMVNVDVKHSLAPMRKLAMELLDIKRSNGNL